MVYGGWLGSRGTRRSDEARRHGGCNLASTSRANLPVLVRVLLGRGRLFKATLDLQVELEQCRVVDAVEASRPFVIWHVAVAVTSAVGARVTVLIDELH